MENGDGDGEDIGGGCGISCKIIARYDKKDRGAFLQNLMWRRSGDNCYPGGTYSESRYSIFT